MAIDGDLVVAGCGRAGGGGRHNASCHFGEFMRVYEEGRGREE